MVEYRQAKDIPDKAFLQAVADINTNQGYEAASRWRVERALGGLNPHGDIDFDEVPGVPSKVALAKARALIKRGLIRGCPCGCRGDYSLTDAGRELMTGDDND